MNLLFIHTHTHIASKELMVDQRHQAASNHLEASSKEMSALCMYTYKEFEMTYFNKRTKYDQRGLAVLQIGEEMS